MYCFSGSLGAFAEQLSATQPTRAFCLNPAFVFLSITFPFFVCSIFPRVQDLFYERKKYGFKKR